MDVGQVANVVRDVDVGAAVDQGVRCGDCSGVVNDAADSWGACDS